MIGRRTLLQASGAALLPLSMPALAQNSRAKTLRFVPQSNLTVLDPIVTTASVTTTHGYCVFDTLYGVDEKLRPLPQMAEGSRLSEDGRVQEITLRPGLMFHDGTPVLARDCAASLQRWAQRDSFGQALAAAVEAWEVPDDRTIRIRLKRPFPQLLRAIAKPHSSAAFMMPERLAKTSPSTPITEMVGSGPFRFLADEYVSGSRTVYARFDGYKPRDEAASWSAGGKRANFDRIEWVVMPDAATASAALQSGEVDWVEQVIGDLVPQLRRQRSLTVRSLDPFGLILGMRFNHATAPFNNPALRQAVLSAVTQEDYLQITSGGDSASFRQCLAMFPCGLPGVEEVGGTVMRQPPDLAKARAAVAASGYKGEKVVMLSPSDNPYIAPLGDVSADLLKRLGLNVELQVMDWGTVVQRRTSREPVEKGGWSIFHTTWPGSSVTNPAENLYIRGAGAQGWFGWHDSPEMERLTQEWLAEADPAKADALLSDVQRSAFNTVPVVPLGQMFPNTAYRSELKDILTASAPFFWNLRRG
jgi:peptide/nickel transport system substrate-binding protein